MNENHDVSEFSCGNDFYDEFLKKEALPHQKDSICSTYVLVKENKVLAYASISPHGIRLNEEDKKRYAEMSARKLHSHYPCLHLSMLARDKKLSGKELGKLMLFCMVILAKDMSGIAKYSYLTVDAEKTRIGYYTGLGFKTATQYKGKNQVTMYVRIDNLYGLLEDLENQDGFKSKIKRLLKIPNLRSNVS